MDVDLSTLRMTPEVFRRACAFFCTCGISPPTPCQLAWYAAYNHKSRALDRAERKKLARQRGGKCRESPMDVPRGYTAWAKVAQLLIERQGLSRNRADEVFKTVCDKRTPLECHSTGCERLAEICIPWRCPEFQETHPYGGPAFDQYLSENKSVIETACQQFLQRTETERGVHALQAPMVGGKTRRLAELALELIGDARPFYVIVDDHETGENFFEELKKARGGSALEADRRIVFLIGTSKSPCKVDYGGYPGCEGCERFWPAQGNRADIQRLSGIFGKREIDSLMRRYGGKCEHAFSRVLAHRADALVMVQHYVLDPSLVEQLPRLRSNRLPMVLWDEADTLLDCFMGFAAREAPLAICRPESLKHPAEKFCDNKCSTCCFVNPIDKWSPVHDPLEPVLDTVRSGAEVFERMVAGAEPPVEVEAVRQNAATLKVLMGTSLGGPGTPQQRINALWRNLKPDALGLFNPGFRETTSEPGRLRLGGFVLAARRRQGNVVECISELLDATPADVRGQLSDDDAECLYHFLRFADATNGATARVEVNRPVRIRGKVRTPCSIKIRRFEHELGQSTVDFLERHGALLMSGTLLDRDMLATQLGTDRERITFEPTGAREMHNSVVFLMWNHRLGLASFKRKANPCLPLELGFKDVLALLAEVHRLLKRERTAALVFADNRLEGDYLIYLARLARQQASSSNPREIDGLSIARYGERKTPEAEDGRMKVDVSYERSDISRGAQQPEYDLAVIFGHGFANARDYRLLASTRPEVGDPRALADDLSRYERQRVVAQAATRIPRDGDRRRVVLLVGEFGPYDLPEYMRNRIVFANEILSARKPPPQQVGEQKKEWQIQSVAEWIATWMGAQPDGDSYKPDRQRLLPPEDNGAAGRYLDQSGKCNAAALRRVYETVERNGWVQPTGEAAHRGLRQWSAVLREMSDVGILQRDLKDRKGGKRKYVRGPRYDLLASWYQAHKERHRLEKEPRG